MTSGVASVCLSRKSGKRMGSVLRFRGQAIAAERAKDLEGFALAAEFVGDRAVVGIAERKPTDHELVLWYPQMSAYAAVIVPRGRLRGGVQAASAGRQHQGLQEDAAIEETSRLQLAVHCQDHSDRRAEKLEIASGRLPTRDAVAAGHTM